MKRLGLLLGLVLCALAAATAGGGSGRALAWGAGQASPTPGPGPIHVAGTPSVVNKFPSEIDFSVDATSTTPITDVELHFALPPDAILTSAKADFDQGTTVHATYVLRTGGNPFYVPPMKTLNYYWTFADQAGTTQQTAPVDYQYLDTRFTFKKATSGNLSLYYHAGSDSDAQRVLAVGRQAIDDAQKLDGVVVEYPVFVVAYQNQNELAAALSHVSKSFDPNILGQEIPPDSVILSVGNLTGSENDDTFRHELTHIVNARAVRGGFSQSLPTWLDEGLAVNAQHDPGGFSTVVNQAIRANQVVPVKMLTPGFEGQNADLFYGESWSIVHFLVQQYGGPKLAQLLAQYKSGAADDAAFQTVYAFNRDGLYNAWRQSVGLQPVTIAAPAAVPSQPAPASGAPSAPTQSGGAQSQGQPQPTVPPVQAPAPAASSSSSSDQTTMIVLGVAIGIAVLALLGVVVIGGLALSRRGRG